MVTLLTELRVTLRALSRSRGLAATALVVVAIGLAAVMAVSALADGLLFRPVRFQDQANLLMVYRTGDDFQDGQFSPASFRDLQGYTRCFKKIAGAAPNILTLDQGAGPEPLPSARVTADFFAVLGTKAELGRLAFLPEEDRWGGDAVVVLTESLWRARFSSDPTIVGRVLRLDGGLRRIVGVLPSDFRPPSGRLGPAKLYIPAAFSPEEQAERSNDWEVFARLIPGRNRAQTEMELQTLVASGSWSWSRGLRTGTLANHLGARWRDTVWMFGTAAALMLLLACINAAHLLLALGESRRRELAIRSALGAGRFALVRQGLLESAVLSFAAMSLALPLAWFFRYLLAWHLELREVPPFSAVLVAIGVLSATISTIAAGIVPVLAVLRVDPGRELSEQNSRAGKRIGSRAWVATVELATAFSLLASTGLLLCSLQNLLRQDAGVDPYHVLAATVQLPAVAYPTPSDRSAFFMQLEARLAGIPGARYTALTQTAPVFQPPGWGHQSVLGGGKIKVWYHGAQGDFPKTLGIPLRAGRLPLPGEHGVVVSDPLAKQLWPDGRPLERFLKISDEFWPVVGVVGGTIEDDLRTGPLPQIWKPLDPERTFVNVFLRVEGDPNQYRRNLETVLRELNSTLRFSNIKPLENSLNRMTSGIQKTTRLLLLLSVVALTLTTAGLYGVISQLALQRRREVGIRMALGATVPQTLSLFLSQGMKLAFGGIAFGILGAALAAFPLRSLLFGVSWWNPMVIIWTACLLLATALIATLVPALHAAQMGPGPALRKE